MKKKPLALHVCALPWAQGDWGVPVGGARGPTTRAEDCIKSAQERQKMRRR